MYPPKHAGNSASLLAFVGADRPRIHSYVLYRPARKVDTKVPLFGDGCKTPGSPMVPVGSGELFVGNNRSRDSAVTGGYAVTNPGSAMHTGPKGAGIFPNYR